MKKKAVLFDVDGVLCALVSHFGEYGVSARKPDEIRIVEDLEGGLNELLGLGFVLLAHSNQPDIARGKITEAFLEEKHEMLFARYPQIRRVFVCPHTETQLCSCFKPKPGLLLQAAAEFNLDLALSYVVGDSRRDVEAGKLVHARTILVQTKYNCGNPAVAIATGVATSTQGALRLILGVEKVQVNLEDV